MFFIQEIKREDFSNELNLWTALTSWDFYLILHEALSKDLNLNNQCDHLKDKVVNYNQESKIFLN